MKVILDYIWLDGNTISDVRFLTKVLDIDVKQYGGIQGFIGKLPRLIETKEDIENIPSVEIDGTLTKQKSSTDLTPTVLNPIKMYLNPTKVNSYYVLCEVYDGDVPHSTNSRNALKEKMPKILEGVPHIGIKEKFIIFKKGDGTGVINPNHLQTYSSRQTNNEVIIDEFLNCIIKMNLPIDEIVNKFNHWEVKTSLSDSLTLSDDIIIMRHLLYRLSNKHDLSVSFFRKYGTEIHSERDKINDPYLLTRKLINSDSE